MSSSIWLITGANRGIGRGIVSKLLLRPATTVIAATRETASWKALHDLPRSDGSRLITVKIDSRSASDASAAASELSTKYEIMNIDVVLANAGVTSDSSSIIDVSIDQIQNLMDVNTYGPLHLFQAMWPLLSAAPSPKFVVISSIVGSIVEVEKFAFANPAYAMSKLAVNYLVRRLHHENERLIAMAIHPGWTQSDMGNLLAARVGMTEAPVAISVSTDGILSEIDLATKESANTFRSFDHEQLSW